MAVMERLHGVIHLKGQNDSLCGCSLHDRESWRQNGGSSKAMVI